MRRDLPGRALSLRGNGRVCMSLQLWPCEVQERNQQSVCPVRMHLWGESGELHVL